MLTYGSNFIFNTENEIYCDMQGYMKLNEKYIYEEISRQNNANNIYLDDNLRYPYSKIKITCPFKFRLYFKDYNVVKCYQDFKELQLLSSNIISLCYNCKKYTNSDVCYSDYIHMCLNCAQYYYEKKAKMADLKNTVAFISGIRKKIGLNIALKLLRCGASVIGTTRYYNATLFNYQSQPDYDEWKDRLQIYVCDFTRLEKVLYMINDIKCRNINFIISNACQTVRASEEYKQNIETLESILENNNFLIKYDGDVKRITHNNMDNDTNNQLVPYNMPSTEIVLNKFQDITVNPYDTSWNKHIQNIDQKEIIEATLINQLVPTLIINQLKPYMKINDPNFIIHVTAYEGDFNKNNGGNHAHTNMCKVAMEMLIATMNKERSNNLYEKSL